MNPFLEKIIKILSQNIIVHIYSSPNFTIEIFIGLAMCAVHCLLIMEINKTIRSLNIPHLKIRVKQSLQEIVSRNSVYQGVVKTHPDLGVDIVFKDNSLLGGEWDTMAKINKILSTSLSEYIRGDLKKIKAQLPVEGGDDKRISEVLKSPSSVEKIYDYLLKEPEMQNIMAAKGAELEVVNNSEIVRLH